MKKPEIKQEERETNLDTGKMIKSDDKCIVVKLKTGAIMTRKNQY